MLLTVDYNKLIAGKEGAIDAITKSMNQFSTEIELQITATKTLTGLAFGIEYNKVLITARGLNTIINNTNNFRKNPELLIINLGCLANLTSADDTNKRTIVNSNIIGIILSVIKGNGDKVCG